MPTTTPERPDEPDLEPWFAAGRANAPEPSPEFLARLAETAEAEADGLVGEFFEALGDGVGHLIAGEVAVVGVDETRHDEAAVVKHQAVGQ